MEVLRGTPTARVMVAALQMLPGSDDGRLLGPSEVKAIVRRATQATA